MNPYNVLGVTPSTSDDDIKRAYRDLARKYHPDNYINNPLADLAQEKMKEINEAYDSIMRERSGNGGTGTQQQQQSSSQQYSGASNNHTNPVYTQVRNAINVGNIGMAEEMLSRASARDAEWHFLMGSVYYKKGWFDEARREFTTASSMNPGNPEYRNAINMINMNAGYGGYRPMDSSGACQCCADLACMSLCCNCCGNGCC